MKCKNCNASLQTIDHYCSVCGAKVIRNRITFRNLFEHFTEHILNVDNSFVNTFILLFTTPEKVIGGYLDGTRKRYMNPLSYFAVAITLSGLMFLVLKQVYGVQLMSTPDDSNIGFDLDSIFNYQGILSYFSVPIYAIITWILFLDLGKFNFMEHLVINLFIVAQYSFVQVVVNLVLFGLFTIDYSAYSFGFTLVIILYQFYILKRLHHIGFLSTMIRAIFYTPMMIMGSIVPVMLIIIFMILTGEISISDFVPKT